MKTNEFFEKFMREEYPNAGKLRRWWERKKYKIWLADEKNRKFIEQIPKDPYDGN